VRQNFTQSLSQNRTTADFVDKILRGTKPADIRSISRPDSISSSI
jgi:hypothetical protein